MGEVIFSKIKFRNFQSFGNAWTEFDLCSPGTNLIMGENLEKGGSVGSGKTTLMSTLSYVLWDKVPSGISKDRLINSTNEKKSTSMEVQLNFKKGSDEYKICRWRGASTGVQLFCNDKDITSDSVSNVNGKIEEILGFSYNLFSQIVIFNGNTTAFLDGSVGEQKSLLDELLKITALANKAKSLKTFISETEKSISLQKALNKQIDGQNLVYRNQLKEAQDRINKWEVQRSSEISQITSTLQKIDNVDFDSEELLHSETERLKTVVANRLSELRAVQIEYSTLEGVIKKNEAEAIKLEKELAHLKDAKCPFCLQHFDSVTKLLEIEEKYITVRTTLDSDRAILEVHKTSVADKLDLHTKATNELKEITSAIQHNNLSELLKIKSNTSVLKEKLETLSKQENPHLEAHNSLLALGETVVDNKAVDDLIKIQDHQNLLLKLLSDKNSFIRKNIISKTIPFLNNRIGYYANLMNMQQIALFQPDMTCKITQFGRELDHGNLSQGEKKALNISLCLAFRDILTYLHTKVNVLFTDEIDGGSLSGPDIESLIGLLKKKATEDDISMFIISHRAEFEGRCDKHVIVRKEAGFSSLIKEEA